MDLQGSGRGIHQGLTRLFLRGSFSSQLHFREAEGFIAEDKDLLHHVVLGYNVMSWFHLVNFVQVL